jgi:putative transposase
MLWIIQQLREAAAFGVQPKYLIRDNDRVYGSGVPTFLRNCEIEEIRTAYHCPWQDPFAERIIGILRRELFDYIISFNEHHLHRLLSEYLDKYYHQVRTHSRLDHKPPIVAEATAKSQSLSGARF